MMRITVNLSIFFHDHRSLAKIFVNKTMKYIKDVEYHISEIFNIYNFYLKCENVYLPPTEDVHILSNDDVIWAIPMEQHASVSEEKQTNLPAEIPNGSECVKDSGRDSLGSSRSEDSSPNGKNINVASLVHTFENKKSNFTTQIQNNTNIPKKINIVKTIIISNKKSTHEIKPSTEAILTSNNNASDNLKPKTETLASHNNTADDPKIITDVEDSKVAKQSEVIHDPSNNHYMCKKKDEWGEYDSSSTFDVASVCNSTLSESGVCLKRKRKRTRRKKHLDNNEKEFDSVFQQPIFSTVQKPLVVQTPKHLRFDDGSTPKNVENVADIQTTVNITESKNGSKHDIPEKISFEQAKTLPDADMVKNLELTYSDKEIENCILKQPITQSAEPKIGDVISFKILRISENYTPEVSSTIVGKVTDYKAANNEVIFDVVYGHDQCVLPQGKFSLDQEEQEEQPVEENKFQCIWSTLLEPKVLCS